MKKIIFSVALFFILSFTSLLFPSYLAAQDSENTDATTTPNLEKIIIPNEGRTQTSFSLSNAQNVSENQNLVFDATKKGSFTTKAIKIELENPTPFISAYTTWKGENLHDEFLTIEQRTSIDGQNWNIWEETAFDGHVNIENHKEAKRLTSVASFLPKETRFVQYRISWKTGSEQTASIKDVEVSFYSPGETPKQTLKKAKDDMTNYMQSGGCSQPPVVSRSSWGANPPRSSYSYTNVTHLVVHHAYGYDWNDGAAAVRAVQDLHQNSNGWSDIGYNYLIHKSGVIYQGRPENVIGAHFCGYNSKTQGICMLGTFTSQNPTNAAMTSLKKLLAWKADKEGINPLGSSYHYSTGGNVKNIAGHRDGGGCTTCPGNSLYSLLPTVRVDVNSMIQNDCGGGTPSDAVNPTTNIAAPSSATSDFTASFTDADNVSVTGRFYQVLENYASETRANRGNGFYNDNFSTGSLHSDYNVGAGSWSANSNGRLVQSNTTSTNTSLSTFLSQTNGQSYLYNFAAKLNSTTGNRRFGIHIMASSQTDSQRGNSYLVWFSGDGGTVNILETINNVLYTRASASLTTGTSWADYKVTYSTSTGKIEVFRNDALLTQWTDSSPLTSGNYISLRTNEANIEVDDLKVYKGRSTGVTVTVGNTNAKDLRTNLAATGQVKSIVRDAAGNFSSVANANVTIGAPVITDITGNWAENEIRYMLNNGFMSGYSDNTFRPNNTTSRAEFATMIAAIIDPAISTDPVVASRSFSDISGHWAEANILKAARAGYLSGYTDGTFRPNDPITRMQVTLSISNGLGLTGGTSSLLNLFTDKNDVPSWAATSVTNGISNRFIANHPNKNYYKPNDNSTRANATVVMYQALRYLNRAPELFNTYIVVPANPASKVAATTNEVDEKILSEMSLFPNPIENSHLNVSYSLKESSDVSIRLYSILGEEVSVLYQGNREAGTHKEEFELSNLRLKAGTYIIRVSSKEGTQTLRLIKL
ncbi:S-layer homology domain-containing protein [Bernardetia sp. OM2101]|uniref:S-layer homology domain-containing protein n=1 Tax=Bernardetia sp. OM2101 TaxID=3344876 RepID=UPI0035D112A5